MPRRGNNNGRAAGAKDAPRERQAPPPAGLPDPRSVIAEGEITSPKGVRYRVLHTTEMDPYDQPAPPPPKRARRRKSPPRSGG